MGQKLSRPQDTKNPAGPSTNAGKGLYAKVALAFAQPEDCDCPPPQAPPEDCEDDIEELEDEEFLEELEDYGEEWDGEDNEDEEDEDDGDGEITCPCKDPEPEEPEPPAPEPPSKAPDDCGNKEQEQPPPPEKEECVCKLTEEELAEQKELRERFAYWIGRGGSKQEKRLPEPEQIPLEELIAREEQARKEFEAQCLKEEEEEEECCSLAQQSFNRRCLEGKCEIKLDKLCACNKPVVQGPPPCPEPEPEPEEEECDVVECPPEPEPECVCPPPPPPPPKKECPEVARFRRRMERLRRKFRQTQEDLHKDDPCPEEDPCWKPPPPSSCYQCGAAIRGDNPDCYFCNLTRQARDPYQYDYICPRILHVREGEETTCFLEESEEDKCESDEFDMTCDGKPVYEGGMCMTRAMHFLWKTNPYDSPLRHYGYKGECYDGFQRCFQKEGPECCDFFCKPKYRGAMSIQEYKEWIWQTVQPGWKDPEA